MATAVHHHCCRVNVCMPCGTITGTPAEGGEGEMVQTEEQLSALRDSLARKGKNSYYYAHTR